MVMTILALSAVCLIAFLVTNRNSKYGYNAFEFYHEDSNEVGVIAFDTKEYTCTKGNEDYLHIKKNGKEIFKGTVDNKDSFDDWKNYDSLGVDITSKEVDNIGYHCIHYVVDESTLEKYKESIESFKNGYTDEQLKEMGIIVEGSELDLDAIGGTCDIYLYFVEIKDKESGTYFYFETLDSDAHLEDFLNMNFAVRTVE